MRTFVIGDIHGNLLALDQVLNLSGFDEKQDTLIGIGDYVDGHPQNVGVVERLMGLTNFIGILGNHDEWCRTWLDTGERSLGWVEYGGHATIESYIGEGKSTSKSHLKFFNNLKPFYIDKNRNFAFVHGGWVSRDGLGNDPEYVYNWDRKLWDLAGHKSTEVYSMIRTRMYDKVFIGHSQTPYDKHKDDPTRYHPEKRLNIWNVDQGAGWDGKLTIMDIDTEEYWQSDLAINFYNKPGR